MCCISASTSDLPSPLPYRKALPLVQGFFHLPWGLPPGDGIANARLTMMENGNLRPFNEYGS